ncbi:MAG TPA: malonyl-CoA decarboxylase [Bryobacteraceae bacterium]|nr:malonyl-CoA decarboxylase [Bryobacteraceae bacterium]
MRLKLADFFGRSANRESSAPRSVSRTASKTISLCHNLLSERGEASGTRLAAAILSSYQALDGPGRDAFFDQLGKEFSPDPQAVGEAGNAYRQDPSPSNLARLQRVVEPPRQELFRRLNMAPGGTRVLVEMRSHLLNEDGQESARAPIATDLGHLLASWFNRGFLVLQRIDWRTSATILEKLIQYEAVHQVQGWQDLRRRLAADRRCYAFFHPALPEEPIMFVEAALTRGMSDKVQPLLDPDSPVANPEAADTAVFYSITNCQKGLRGVPFGSFLIKQVVEDLSHEFPRIRRFATLSPVPGFRAWLSENLSALERATKFLNLSSLVAKLEDCKWFENASLSSQLQHCLVPLCTYYLLHAKRGKEPADPVARFHLRNGARLERINWLADTSKASLERSAGLMANYLYRRADLARNHEFYTRDYKVMAAREIETMAKQAVTAPLLSGQAI